jgi:1,4-alpha-glucan branching enzyme
MSIPHAVAIVLHAHLPYIPATEGGQSMEERWLFEVLWESYLPLLDVLERLARDGVSPRWTVSVSPPLLAMLAETERRDSFRRWLTELQETVASERRRPERSALGDALLHIGERLAGAARRFDAIGGDVARALTDHHTAGHIELITTAASHAYLPLLTDDSSVRFQLQLGAAAFGRATGLTPRGRWLPECAYEPRLQAALAAEGVGYVVVDAHALPDRAARGFEPCRGSAGVVFFPRDPSTARRVWSRSEGYPRDPRYREYYQHLALQAEPEVAQTAGLPSGIKPYCITGEGADKRAYDAAAADALALRHAEDFVEDRWRALVEHPRREGALIAVAPFDAELFGHWWYEGPRFLEQVARALDRRERRGEVCATTLAAWLDVNPPRRICDPDASSWGEGGFSSSWFGPSASRYYRHLRHASRATSRAVQRCGDDGGLTGRALDQGLRELALAQASDWVFMAERGEVIEYARRRLETHTARAIRLAEWAERGELSPAEAVWLERVEREDRFLSDLRGSEIRDAWVGD